MDKQVKWAATRGGLGMEVVIVDNDLDTEVFRAEVWGWIDGFGFKVENGQTVFIDKHNQTILVTSAPRPAVALESFTKYLLSQPALPSLPEGDYVGELTQAMNWEKGE